MAYDAFSVFPSELGWMAIAGRGEVLRQLSFGHGSAEAAVRRLGIERGAKARGGTWNRQLAARLQAYAAGGAGRLSRRADRRGGGKRLPSPGSGYLPKHPLRQHSNLWSLGGLGWFAPRRPSGGHLHGLQSDPAGDPLPSRGCCGRVLRPVLSPWRDAGPKPGSWPWRPPSWKLTPSQTKAGEVRFSKIGKISKTGPVPLHPLHFFTAIIGVVPVVSWVCYPRGRWDGAGMALATKAADYPADRAVAGLRTKGL